MPYVKNTYSVSIKLATTTSACLVVGETVYVNKIMLKGSAQKFGINIVRLRSFAFCDSTKQRGVAPSALIRFAEESRRTLASTKPEWKLRAIV